MRQPYYSSDNLARLGGGLDLPLAYVRDFGGSNSSVIAVPTGAGVLVHVRDYVGLWTRGFGAEVWSHELKGWAGHLSVGQTDLVLGTLSDDTICRISMEGRQLSTVTMPSPGIMLAHDQGRLVTFHPSEHRLRCVDGDVAAGWALEDVHPSDVILHDNIVLATMDLGRSLSAFDARDGHVLWRFEVPLLEGTPERDRRNRLIAGLPSVAVARGHVIVIAVPRVFILRLADGQLVGERHPPFTGSYLVTNSSVFFLQPYGLSEFDYWRDVEVGRIQYEKEVAPLYRNQPPTVCGFWVSDDTVVWTTLQGALMAVSRNAGPDGSRAAWCREIPGALLPIGIPPVVRDGFVYCRDDGNMVVSCYQSARAGRDG